MQIKLKIWRQPNNTSSGFFEKHILKEVTGDMSFLEMLDLLNNQLVKDNKEPVAFDHDCREGICGTCGVVINGRPHGPLSGVTTCQLHMRSFNDGDTIVIEPFRAKSFPIIKDLSVDRTSFDRIISAGGYVSVATGQANEANATPIPKENADAAFESATCIGCGACVASCKNSSAMLFVGAKVTHLALLPQGQTERSTRSINMVNQMDNEGFGGCTNTGACEVTCPKNISTENIVTLNREFIKSNLS
jgi:succinate dehydrogenase / fumarate reductase iron-sulfur subunit|tara:strand:+ start:714 stop:1454 length:741 start_codon:yes stop_codon:yes gene_type:complete